MLSKNFLHFKNRKVLKTIILFLLISLTSYSETKARAKTSSTITQPVFPIPTNRNRLNFTVNVGTIFTIKVKGNPTTGYGWYLDNAANLDTNVIQALNLDEHNSGRYESDPHLPGMVGVGGNYYFNFIGNRRANMVLLRFVEKRPWESIPYRTVYVYMKLV